MSATWKSWATPRSSATGSTIAWIMVFFTVTRFVAAQDETSEDAATNNTQSETESESESPPNTEPTPDEVPPPESAQPKTDTPKPEDSTSEDSTSEESASEESTQVGVEETTEIQPKMESADSTDGAFVNMSLEELLNVEVTTASKRSEPILTAPSNITVITAKQIKDWGLRDLQDVLRRVAGYMVLYDRDEWVYSARGNVSDNNQKYLLLIDGHRMNSTENFGPGQIIELPMDLSNVKRIEVIKGPGSAVWGSEALAGVINVITMNGADLGDQNYRAAVTYGNSLYDRGAHTGKANFQVGNTFGDEMDIILSGAVAASKGTQIEADSSTGLPGPYLFQTYCGDQICPDGDTTNANTAPPFGRYVTDLSRFKPSYMLHAKSRLGDFSANALFFHTQVKNRHFESNDFRTTPDGTYLNRSTWYTTDKVFVEGAWNKTLANDGRLTVKASGDRIDSQFVPTVNPALFISWKESRFLSSIDSTFPFFDGLFDLNMGVDYAYTNYGPSLRFDSLDPTQNASQVDGANDGLITKLTDDNNLGGYALLGLHIIDKKLHLTGGTRIDYNGSDRGDTATALAPRAGIIFVPKQMASFKLVYNSGFLRPANFQRSLLKVEPEKMHQVELISMVNLDPMVPLSFTATGYWQTLQGIILIANSSSSGYLGNGFTNTGDYTSWGAELEALLHLNNHDVWGNVSWANPRGENYIDGLALDAMRIKPDSNGSLEGQLLNYPTIMFNLGGTLRIKSVVSISPALRFQGAMNYRSAPPIVSLDDAVYERSDPMAFVDLNIGVFPHEMVEVFVNAKNLFNEKGPEPISVWNGTRELYGTYVEATLRIKY